MLSENCESFLEIVKPFEKKSPSKIEGLGAIRVWLKDDVHEDPDKWAELFPAMLKADGKYIVSQNAIDLPMTIETAGEILMEVPLSKLHPGPQPRIEVDEEEDAALTEDIKANGLKERIEVKESVAAPGEYDVVEGHRRFNSVTALAWATVPVKLVKKLTEREGYERAIVVNQRRRNLTLLDKGHAMSELLKLFPETYPTLETLIARWGTTLDVNTHERATQLIEYYEDYLKSNNVTRVTLSEGAARAVRRAPFEARDRIREVAESGDVSVRGLEQIVHDVKDGKPVEEAIDAVTNSADELLEKNAATVMEKHKTIEEQQKALAKKFIAQFVPEEIATWVAENCATEDFDFSSMNEEKRSLFMREILQSQHAVLKECKCPSCGAVNNMLPEVWKEKSKWK